MSSNDGNLNNSGAIVQICTLGFPKAFDCTSILTPWVLSKKISWHTNTSPKHVLKATAQTGQRLIERLRGYESC